MVIKTILYSLLSVFIVSLLSFLGLFGFSVKEKKLKKVLIYFISLAAGALFGDVFNVTIKAKDSAKTVIPIPGHYVIESTGLTAGNRLRLRMVLPKYPVSATLWEYAIFSGGEIVK